MSRQRLPLLRVCLARLVERPNLEQVVATARDEPPVARSTGSGGRAGDGARGERGRPRYRVDAEAVRVDRDVVDGAAVLELEDGDVAVGGGTGEEAAGFVGGPGDDVDRGLVQGEVVYALPLRRLLGALLLPDEDFAVVAC